MSSGPRPEASPSPRSDPRSGGRALPDEGPSRVRRAANVSPSLQTEARSLLSRAGSGFGFAPRPRQPMRYPVKRSVDPGNFSETGRDVLDTVRPDRRDLQYERSPTPHRLFPAPSNLALVRTPSGNARVGIARRRCRRGVPSPQDVRQGEARRTARVAPPQGCAEEGLVSRASRHAPRRSVGQGGPGGSPAPLHRNESRGRLPPRGRRLLDDERHRPTDFIEGG